MKKYIYSACLLGVIIYSCKTNTATQKTNSTAGANLSEKEILQKGEVTFNQSCGRCHGLPSPQDHTATDWKSILNAMAPKAKLTAEQTDWVLAYLNSNSKK